MIQLRARDVVSRAGRGTGGGYALRVERIRPAFLRMSYVDGNLEAYWDTGVYEGRPLFAGAVQSCTGYFRNCRYGTAAIVTQYNVNGGSWEEHQAGDPAKPPPDINSSIAQATKAVAGIVAGDRLAFRARYATSQDDYAQSLLQTFYGEIRLPAPTDLTLQKRMLENEIMTYQITAQWSAPEFSGDSLGDLNWHYLMQLNENDALHRILRQRAEP